MCKHGETVVPEDVASVVGGPGGSNSLTPTGDAPSHRRAGNGDSLVLIHPTAGAWSPVSGLLAADHEVVAVDLPGFGGTPELPGALEPSVPRLADAVERHLQILGVARFHLAGNSLGGWVALELARRGLARSVVAIAPVGLGTPSENRRSWRRLRRVRALSVLGRPLVQLTGSTALGRTALGFSGMTLARPWRHRQAEMVEAIDEFYRAPAFLRAFGWAFQNTAYGLEQISCPTTLAWGRRDLILPVRQVDRFAARLPRAELRILPGAGHFPMSDQPRLIQEVILETTARAKDSRSSAAIDDSPTASASGNRNGGQ